MAYYTRKRVYAGPTRYGGAKRMKYSSRRRSSYGRRNVRRGMPYRRNAVMTTNGLRGTGLTYKSRRVNRSLYQKRLWDSTSSKEHYRSVRTYINSIPTGATRDVSWFQSLRMIGPDFYTPVDGAQAPIQFSTRFAQEVTIRGGKSVLRAINNSIDQIFVRVWVIRTILGGVLPVNGTYPTGWDPTMSDSFKRDFKIHNTFAFTLDVNESFNLEHRLGIREWDLADSKNQYVWNWSFLVTNLRRDVVSSLDVHVGHNLSFTGDIAIE